WQLYDDSENELVEKQAHMEHAYKIGEKITCEIGIQTDKIGIQITNETREIGVQVSDITLHALESQVYLLQLQLNSKISEIKDLKNQLEYTYDYVIESWERVREIEKNIDNKKHNCPQCNERLDTLAALQEESANEFIPIYNIDTQSKSLVIRSYTYTHELKSSYLDRISLTQKSKPKDS
ncbi:6456_t:CDS:2, partial [Racocetra fulgida]